MRGRGRDALAFQVDLWKARGELLKDMIDVEVRHKEIIYVQFKIVWQAAHNWLSPLIAASASCCC